MELVIKLISLYWADLQQTAIANPRFSIILAALALLMGGLIVAILKRGKIAGLKRQVTQEKQQLEKTEKTHEELLTKQKNYETQITDVQQQLEQATKNLQHERNEHQSTLSTKDKLFIETANKKQQEVVEINTMLDEKTLLVDRLQGDLNEQESKIAKYAKAQAQIVEMEKQVYQSETELNTVKQQLETELNNKNEQIEQSAKIHKDRVSELELQLEKISDTSVAENIQQQVINQQSEKNQIIQEKEKLEVKADNPLVDMDTDMDTEIDLDMDFDMEIDMDKEMDKTTIQQNDSLVAIPSEKSDTQEIHVESLEQEISTAKEQTSAEKQGVVGQVLGWFSSMDKALENNEVNENNLESVEEVEIKRKPVIKENLNSEDTISDDEESSFSEKLAGVADKMDSFSGKFKNLYHKVKK